ncbi:hypothetical protein DSO57_1003631 [Entomophthora muscae]|uniref:Uncharacterized protein n=1 Tax=Entomophthora muscae TaxID=34485 RepID=A0ACC2SLE8_9FUNG|nr:hypothetical protein DSO57_1003631 [Entomophthora muscae]
MTPPLTPQPDRPMETLTSAKTTFTQLFGVLYIPLTGTVDTMAPKSGLWSLLRQSVSYIIKLAPILWWALPSGPVVFCPEPANASTYAWLPDIICQFNSNPSGLPPAIFVPQVLPLILSTLQSIY